MSTVIYLSNQDVRVVVGKGKGSQASVSRVCRAQAPEGSIINGLVTNEEAFDAFFREFWSDNQLPKKGVTLVLGSAQAVTRLLHVPKMSHKKMMEYLPREFAEVERTKDPVYSYALMSKAGAMRHVLATMIDRSFLEPHMERFRAMGIRLESIVMATMAEILALNHLSYLRDKTCVIQTLDGMSLLNVLYVNGEYYQFSRSRVFGERGTMAFGVECARTISNQQQFLKTQQIEDVITHIYLGGEFEEEDVEVCKDSIFQMDGSLEVETIYEEAEGRIRFRPEQEVSGFGHFATAIGGLLVSRDQSNLLYQYRRNPERMKRRRELIRLLAPLAAVSFLLGAVAAAQAFIWFSRVDTVNEQYQYLENPAVISMAAEYDQLAAENGMLDTRIGIIRKTQENLDTYPVYATYVKDAIQGCAAGVAAADITSFDASQGRVTVEASAGDADLIHQFVERLEARADLFGSVFYDGFNFDERSGSWKSSVVCYLAMPVQIEEVTP